jgi:hypothetical protein
MDKKPQEEKNCDAPDIETIDQKNDLKKVESLPKVTEVKIDMEKGTVTLKLARDHL